MNALDYYEQRTLLERLVIGLEEPILVKGIGELSAKIDSGNGGYNVIHGTDIYSEGDMLHFTTLDANGNKKHVATKSTERIQVNIGGGNIQDRPVIYLDVKFANSDYEHIPFSVTDRSGNEHRVLICKSFVQNELDALIDVGETNISKENIQAAINEAKGGDGVVGKVKGAVDSGLTSIGKALGKVISAPAGLNKKLGELAQGAKKLRTGESDLNLLQPFAWVGSLVSTIFSQQWLKNLGWGAVLTSVAMAHPYLTGAVGLGYLLFSGKKNGGKMNTRGGGFKKFKERSTKCAKRTKEVNNKAMKNVGDYKNLSKEDKKRMREDKEETKRIIERLRQQGYVRDDDEDNEAEIVEVLNYTGRKGGKVDVDSQVELQNKLRLLVQSGKNVNNAELFGRMSGEKQPTNASFESEAFGELLNECRMILLEDGEATPAPADVQENGQEAQTTKGEGEQQPEAHQDTQEETQGFEELNETLAQIEECAEQTEEAMQELYNRKQFILYYANVKGNGIKSLQDKVINGNEAESEINEIYSKNQQGEVTQDDFKPLVKKIVKLLKDAGEGEAVGYFALALSEGDDRQFVFFNNDDEMLLVKASEAGVDIAGNVPAFKDFLKAFGVKQTKVSGEETIDVPSFDDFLNAFGMGETQEDKPTSALKRFVAKERGGDKHSKEQHVEAPSMLDFQKLFDLPIMDKKVAEQLGISTREFPDMDKFKSIFGI